MEIDAVSMKETAFGCLKEQHKQDLIATFKAMSLEEKAEIMKELNSALEEGINHGFNEGKTEEDYDKEVAI